eukprot:6458291-Amphidinium_carterae.1
MVPDHGSPCTSDGRTRSSRRMLAISPGRSMQWKVRSSATANRGFPQHFAVTEMANTSSAGSGMRMDVAWDLFHTRCRPQAKCKLFCNCG